jgi:hypothetical protein
VWAEDHGNMRLAHAEKSPLGGSGTSLSQNLGLLGPPSGAQPGSAVGLCRLGLEYGALNC